VISCSNDTTKMMDPTLARLRRFLVALVLVAFSPLSLPGAVLLQVNFNRDFNEGTVDRPLSAPFSGGVSGRFVGRPQTKTFSGLDPNFTRGLVTVLLTNRYSDLKKWRNTNPTQRGLDDAPGSPASEPNQSLTEKPVGKSKIWVGLNGLNANMNYSVTVYPADNQTAGTQKIHKGTGMAPKPECGDTWISAAAFHSISLMSPAAKLMVRADAGGCLTFSIEADALLSGFEIGSTEEPKLVFAHYMVSNRDYGFGVEAYKHDIRDAQAYGIDGFMLNLGSWSGNYKIDLPNIYKAAEELGSGFKLCLSVDMTGNLTAEQIQELVRTYANHPNEFLYQGRPVLTTYSGGQQNGQGAPALDFWMNQVLAPLRKAGINVYFVPFFRPDGRKSPSYEEVLKNYNAWWNKVADGGFAFAIPSVSGTTITPTESENYAKVFHDAGKSYMAPVLPQYWGSRQPKRRYFAFQGAAGLEAQWQSILNVQKPEWVELVTWNDFDEATHFTPIDDVNKYWPFITHKTLGFYQNRIGLVKLDQYYIDWYKHYSPTDAPPPPGGKDNLYYIYRTQSKDLKCDDPKGPVTSIYGDVQDDLFVTTILTAPATLRVTSGGTVTSYNLKTGLQNTSISFKAGAQKFELVRNNQTVIAGDGPDIDSAITEYNYIYTSGWLSGS
jgi:glucan endo-1,3-alpha-glucosidase